MPEPNYVFFYGTLKKGGRLHRNVEQLRGEFVGDATIRARMHDLGWYPGVVSDDEATTRGEIWLFRENPFPRLDAVEGVPTLYQRKLVEAWGNKAKYDMKVWAYFYQPPILAQPVVEGGNWEVAR